MSQINGLSVKRELTQYRVKGEDALALLSGFVRVGSSVVLTGEGMGLMLDCQTGFVRDYINGIIIERFKTRPVPSSKTLSSGEVVKGGELGYPNGGEILRALKIISDDEHSGLNGIDESFFAHSEHYVRGVFLGSGSLSVPNAEKASTERSGGYHLEFSLSTEALANDFIAMLSRFAIYGHLTVRGDKYVVYVKDSESVSDCLALMGANKTVLKLNEAVAAFAVKSDANRRTNCDMANISRTLDAASGVVAAINVLKSEGVVLDDKLNVAVEARLNRPEASLDELATEIGISKSGLKHRFDKILQLAENSASQKEE